MNIPFKAGLNDKQRAGIQKLVDEKAVSEWSATDKLNWDYSTNGAPLPIKASRSLFIDLGHSSRFPGASGFKTEIAWNRSIWYFLKDQLDTSYWNIVLVPESYGWWDWSSNRNLINRISFINSKCKDGDWLLSIHGNGSASNKVRGVTTCYMGGSEYMRRKAIDLSAKYAEITGIPIWNGGAFDDRNGRYGRIGMVRDTIPPALLIEAGFVSNAEDMRVEAKTAASAIANWFNALGSNF